MRRSSLYAAVLAAGAVAAAVVAAPAASAAGTGAWQTVPLPASVTLPAVLDSVTAVGPLNAWAAGSESMTSTTAGTPLILHWDGQAWAKAPLPGVTWSGVLASVSASSPFDAWAAGRDTTGRSHLLHWNGLAWHAVSFPGGNDTTLAIHGIAAGLDGTAWFVGGRGNNNAVVEEWNGHAWRVVQSPVSSGDLFGVRVKPGGDAWVTGQELTSASPNGIAGVILRRHDGAWSTVTTVGVPPANPVSGLDDVLAASPGDIWTVGWVSVTIAPGFSGTQPWIGHWNGTSWDTSVRVPAELIGQNNTITPDLTGQPQWIGAATSINPANTLYAHFDGTAWSAFNGSALSGVFLASSYTAHIPGTNATWGVSTTAVDTANGIQPDAPLIELNTG